MLVRAREGVRDIANQLEFLLTVSMMSRATLNLRKQARCNIDLYRPQVDGVNRIALHDMPIASTDKPSLPTSSALGDLLNPSGHQLVTFNNESYRSQPGWHLYQSKMRLVNHCLPTNTGIR